MTRAEHNHRTRARRHAAWADLKFRDGLTSALEQCDLSGLPNAMNWWIASGRASTLPPRSALLSADAAPRDLILVEYVRTHGPHGDMAAALAAIDALREHMLMWFGPAAQ